MAAALTMAAGGCAAVPRRYTCARASGAIVIDGRLDDPGWRSARWTHAFVDIVGPHRPRPRFATRARLAWDDTCLYLAADLEEPHVCGELTSHDAVVYHDNDFEVFIDPDGDGKNYYEIEVNALNTVFDLLLERSYRDGGPARHDWDCAGMRTAVHIDGTLNDPADRDRGWSVEMALPWPALAEHATCPVPPARGDTWRLNMSRVQWRYRVENGGYQKRSGLREDNWVWSPQGEVDMHIPQRWGYITFVD